MQVDSVFILAESVAQEHRVEDPEECGMGTSTQSCLTPPLMGNGPNVAPL